MFIKKTNRLIAFILALLILVTSLSTMLVLGEQDFTPENLLATHLESAQGILFDKTNNTASINSKFDQNGAIAASTDGDKTIHTDVWGWDANTGVGVLFTLDNTYYAGKINITSGLSGYPDTYRVYASASIDDLYSAQNQLVTGFVCESAERVIEVNKQVKFVAFIFESDGGRVKEFEIWSAEDTTPPPFASENLLKTHLLSAEGILFDKTNNTASTNSKFDQNGAIAASTDGDKTVHTDVWGWDANTGVGVLFTLDNTYYAGKINITSGLSGYPDTYRVYASASIDDLYSAQNQLVTGFVCESAERVIEVNKQVKFVAFIFESDGGRVKEFEIWSAEDTTPPPFASENLLKTHLLSAEGILLDKTNNTASTNSKFDQNGAIAASTDGDKTAHTDVWGWDANTGVGVIFTLDNIYYSDKITITSGLIGYPDTYSVFASDNRSNLFDSSNKVAAGFVCENDERAIEISKDVQYIAFVFESDGGRVKEFELWSAEKSSNPDPGPNPPPGDLPIKKVLTIGNSFSENASAFATEIAVMSGYNMHFAYLKYPSCTIEQHLNNLNENKAEYKFAYTEYNGAVKQTVIKDGAAEKATVTEALLYTDWDVIVLQQSSVASYDYSSYAKTADLISGIKQYCPNAEIMVHETWSWDTWAEDKLDENNFKHIEDCYHKMAIENGNLKIIPSGRAFEFARRDYKLSLNDSDHQHANTYGQYLAGACYVATICGVDITQNQFGNGHPYFSGVNMANLRSAVMNAINFVYDPETNWDHASPKDTILKDESSPNFIRRHIESYSEVSQSVKTKEFQDNTRFSAGETDAAIIAIDGDSEKTFDVWGALDWEHPINIGVKYNLDAYYNVDKAVITAGTPDLEAVFDVYASDTLGTLYNAENRVAENVVCKGERIEIPIGKKIQYVIFVITGYNQNNNNNIIKIAEFDLVGSDKAIEKEKIVWPTVPEGTNILSGATPIKIIAPQGDFKSTKEFDYKFMDGNDESDLKYLTDGVTAKHYDIWSLTETDKPGVLYDLGAYYDLSHLHAWAGADGSEMLVVNGYKVYASDSLQDLYKSANLIFDYSHANDSTNEFGLNGDFKRVRYVAFLLTNSIDGAWRMREFAAYGNKSADQSEPIEQKSIIEGIEAEYYGVATTDLKDPIYMGASDFIAALTDGKRDAVEFWGGADINNSKFVFIYNLYENYDLTGIDIYAFADSIEEDSGIHKGIRSAKVYASRKFDDLFAEANGVVLKTDYASKTEPDETSFYSTDALSSWKSARYVAFVFTIGDSRYGACRLEELKVYGTLSAVQDVEEEEAKLPQYIDIKSDNGVVARIFAYNATDDLSKLDAHLKADISKKETDLSFVNDSLSGYKASSIYDIKIVNTAGAAVLLGGRRVRLSIPEKDLTKSVACVDDFGAEIISSGILDGYITVQTETLRRYAIVSNEAQAGGFGNSPINPMLVITVCMGVLAGLGIGTSVFLGIRLKKK